MAFRSKYTTAQMEELFDKINGIGKLPEVKIDTNLSITSENPVQNKVITSEINDIKNDVKDTSENVSKLTEQIDTLSDKVDEVESGGIVWNDVK